MKNKQQRTKNQHYVPQFLLRRFGDENGRINVFDKHTQKAFVSSTRNVASENGFYDLKVGDIQISLESLMCEVENSALGLLNGIVEAETISHLSPDDRFKIAFFMAFQMLRTRASLEALFQMEAGLRRTGPSKGITPETMPGLFMNDEQIKQMSLMNLKMAQDIAPEFLNKDWMLYRDRGCRFLVSDNPVVRKNHYPEDPLMSNNGLACEGIQIYIPLSPEFTITFICPTLIEQFREHERKLGKKLEIPLLDAVDKGVPIDMVDDSLLFQNSMQVAFSNRFVFSNSSDFSLVKKMIKETPSVARPKYLDIL